MTLTAFPDHNVPAYDHLLLPAANGDKEAFRQLFDQLWDIVYSAALRLTKSPEQAQDLAQEVFIKLWDNRASLREVRNIKAFLYIITRNLTHDYLRRKTFHDSNHDFLTGYFSPEATTPQQLLEQKELGGLIRQAVDNLPEHLRQVFTLFYLDGISHKEIAARLQITTITSRVYLVRALDRLRKQLHKDSPGARFSDLLIVSLFLLNFFTEKG